MYSGSHLVQLLKEKSTYLSEASRQGNGKASRSPPFGAYLTVLNDLAQNDLNFQNLLVLHNLVGLCLDVEDNKRQMHHSVLDMKGNCLAELVDKLGQQLGQTGRLVKPLWTDACAVVDEKSASRSSTGHDVRQASQSSGVVMGYPAMGQLSDVQTDANWLPGLYDAQQQPYASTWSSRWPWHNWSTPTCEATSVHVSQDRTNKGEKDATIEETMLDDGFVDGHDQGSDRHLMETDPLLYKCNSWPSSIPMLISEGRP